MRRYNHSFSLDATIMVSKNCPIIGEHVVIIFVVNFLYSSQINILGIYKTINHKKNGINLTYKVV